MGHPPLISRLVFVLAALPVCLSAQFFPFPGPGSKGSGGGGGGGSTPAFVQANACVQSTSATTLTCAYGSNITAGNLLVLVAGWDDSAATPTTLTFSNSVGTGCSAFSTAVPKFLATASGASRRAVQVGYCIAANSVAYTPQITLAVARGYRELSILEYSGVVTTSSLDVVATSVASPSATTACTSSATAALAGNNELAIGACMVWDTAVSPWNSVSGWTHRGAASNAAFGIYDSVRANTTAVTFSYTLGSADVWAGWVATFKPAP